jgi:hypothetical protein
MSDLIETAKRMSRLQEEVKSEILKAHESIENERRSVASAARRFEQATPYETLRWFINSDIEYRNREAGFMLMKIDEELYDEVERIMRLLDDASEYPHADPLSIVLCSHCGDEKHLEDVYITCKECGNDGVYIKEDW